jgi:hypothetical protein
VQLFTRKARDAIKNPIDFYPSLGQRGHSEKKQARLSSE